MTEHPAPQGVNRLKELLFEREARRLDDLSRRLDAQAVAVAERDKTFATRLDAVFERAGSQDRLLHSVAGIIDGALREAEQDTVRHEKLSSAIAPLIVKTIKVQLLESQDEMVDALYPITGRMVKSYVQSAINDMMAEINAKLGGRRARLAADSASTGLSVGELALAGANKLEIEELFLVRRGSGDLIAHWERKPVGAPGARPGGSNRDVLVSGYLSGITSLSEEAFGAKPGGFRTLDLGGGERIFVRGAAAHLLAVRCKGSASAPVEHVIDEVFLETLERYQQVLAADAARRKAGPEAASQAPTDLGVRTILPAVVQEIEASTSERTAALLQQQAAAQAQAQGGPSFTRLYVVAACLAAPFLAWGGWSIYQSYQTGVTQALAQRILQSTVDIKGVPPKIDVDYGGRSLTISGFVPDAALHDQILARLAAEVPQASVRNQLGVLPAGSGPAEIAITALRQQWAAAQQAAVVRPVERARERLATVRAKFKLLDFPVDATGRADVQSAGRNLADAASALDEVLPGAERASNPGAERALKQAWRKLALAETDLDHLLGATTTPTGHLADPPSDPVQVAEQLSMTADRLSVLVALPVVHQQVGALAATTTALAARIDHIRTPRDELEAFVRTNAVFFDNGIDFKDAVAANRTLDALAQLMRRNADAVVRVVGFTDEKGSLATNTDLAQARANRVVGLLSERGIPGRQCVAIGRLQAKDLSRAKGPGNVNRRVEFEVGLAGETGDQ